jgi:hypothetical protein
MMLDFPTAWSPKNTSLYFAKADIAAISSSNTKPFWCYMWFLSLFFNQSRYVVLQIFGVICDIFLFFESNEIGYQYVFVQIEQHKYRRDAREEEMRTDQRSRGFVYIFLIFFLSRVSKKGTRWSTSMHLERIRTYYIRLEANFTRSVVE